MEKLKFILKTTLLVILGIGVLSLAIMLLWNWLIPTIFGLTIITFWQSLGLFVLSKILFSGFSGARHSHSERKKSYWHDKFEQKWSKMPKEKRDEYMQKMRNKGFESEQKIENHDK